MARWASEAAQEAAQELERHQQAQRAQEQQRAQEAAQEAAREAARQQAIRAPLPLEIGRISLELNRALESRGNPRRVDGERPSSSAVQGETSRQDRAPDQASTPNQIAVNGAEHQDRFSLRVLSEDD